MKRTKQSNNWIMPNQRFLLSCLSFSRRATKQNFPVFFFQLNNEFLLFSRIQFRCQNRFKSLFSVSMCTSGIFKQMRNFGSKDKLQNCFPFRVFLKLRGFFKKKKILLLVLNVSEKQTIGIIKF